MQGIAALRQHAARLMDRLQIQILQERSSVEPDRLSIGDVTAMQRRAAATTGPQDAIVTDAAARRAIALATLHQLPAGSARGLADLADRIGVEKLLLIQWLRADLELARLIETKITQEARRAP